MPRNLTEVLSAWVEESAIPEAAGITVTGLCLDSRKIQPGDAFIAVAGQQQHGLEYAKAAVAAGAVAVVCDQADAGLLEQSGLNVQLPRLCKLIVIPQLASHLAELASCFYAAPADDMLLLAVTGTNGKTSVADFIAQGWQQWQGSAGIVGTLGAGPLNDLSHTGLTTPDIFSVYAQLADLRARGIELTAMEVSSHALDQGRVDLLSFDLAVFTNLSQDHLDYHGSMENYAAAKLSLFRDHQPRFAVLNIADKIGSQWQTEMPENVQLSTYFGASAGPGDQSLQADMADVYASHIETTLGGLKFRLHSPWGEADICSQLVGRFNLDNLLATATVLGLLGMPFANLCHALSLILPVRGRMQRLDTEVDQPLVVIDYAHTPDALTQALQSLRPHTQGQLFCVFGCGGDRDRTKRALMATAAELNADRIILTSDNPRTEDPLQIINDTVKGFQQATRVIVEADRANAIRLAIYAAKQNDVILIAGKGHETYQDIGGEKIPFDDVTEAHLALGIAA